MTVQPGATRTATGLRNTRYGEIILVRPAEDGLRGAVYNTTGLNDCPLDVWRSLDPQRLARDAGVPAALLNGPRFWTMDRLTAVTSGEVRDFDGLCARLVADLLLPTDANVAERKPGGFYTDVIVERRPNGCSRRADPSTSC